MNAGDTPKLVRIVWHDAEDGHETWLNDKEVGEFGDTETVVTSVGWELKRTKAYVTIAADYVNDGDYGRVCKIPLAMVLSTQELSDGST